MHFLVTLLLFPTLLACGGKVDDTGAPSDDLTSDDCAGSAEIGI